MTMSSSNPELAVRYRRTRFVCVADTHNRPVKLPKGDVLIHAGDLTNQGSYSELSKAVQWLEKSDFEAKIVIAGNHDLTLDRNFYARSDCSFRNENIQDPEKSISLLTSSPTITYLCHEQATIRLTKPDGPRTTFTVFGSPYSPRVGNWAFDYPRPDPAPPPPSPPDSHTQPPSPDPPSPSSRAPPGPVSPPATTLWSTIPPTTDILITHTPPHHHCDRSTTRGGVSLGCEDLRRALWRVRPRLHVCGHVHEGRGAERVRWDIRGGEEPHAEIPPEEEAEWRWTDPSPDAGDRKISLVDLTGRRRGDGAWRGRPLDNDGALGPAAKRGSGWGEQVGCLRGGSVGQEEAGDDDVELQGWGGDPENLSAGCDRAALLGRMGRRETCVVNCAIAATSWPHVGGKKFHKPIVVDLDLPVWDG